MQIDRKRCESCSLVSECAICLQECIHAVRLPCSHIFCYLCVKGAANQSNRCAVCRQLIPSSYLENPHLLENIDSKDVPIFDNEFQWVYEGRNGWWIYDMRTSLDIEMAFKDNQNKCQLLIAGFIYIIDFQRMIQFRRNEPNRIRRIRRDRIDVNTTKGVAGLRTDFIHITHSTINNQESDPSNSGQILEDSENSQINDSGEERLQRINSNSESNERERSERSETEANNITGSDNPENASNGQYRDVVQLEQLLSNNLTLRDSRETYL